MTLRSERDVILDHALQNEENLEVALKIGAAYGDLCSRLIMDFLRAVERGLSARLGKGWKVEMADPNQFANRWALFLKAGYLGHPGQFEVLLCGDESGYPKQVYLAARSTGGQELHERVKAAIDENAGKGSRTPYSIWYRYIDKAYSNWGSEDTTLLLYRKGELVDHFVARLEQIARAVEQALTAG